MNYKKLNGISIREGFIKFIEENPHIYLAFEKHALDRIAKGAKRLSSKLIINIIRNDESHLTSDQNFKINDAYQSYFARLFIEKRPEHTGVFEFRKLRNEEVGPYMNVDPITKQISFL